MADAKRRDNWQHTAWVAHFIINQNRGKDDPFITAHECNPYEQQRAQDDSVNDANMDVVQKCMETSWGSGGE